MIHISQDQALQRWDALPMSLREALSSEANTDFLLKTCAGENIVEPRVYTVSRIAGYVLLGFLHPEDVARELVDALKIDSKTAKSIQDALAGRIFAPLRADIDKAYAPLSDYIASSTPIAGPKIIQDVSIAPPKPVALPTVGWSKMSPSAISSIPIPAASRPIMTPPAPMTSAAPTEPAPIILHEDTAFKAAEKNAGFTLARPGGGADMQLGGHGSFVPTPPRPAVLEFGGAKPAVPVPNAVHNTGQSVSLSAMPTANTGPRSVSQITPAAAMPTPPKPPAPPAPPSPSNVVPMPQPPQPPSAPQSAKPIVKDFL